MPPPMAILLLLLLSLLCFDSTVAATTFHLQLHHRFSDKFRSLSADLGVDDGNWPEKGTVKYYESLAEVDRARMLTFSGGNMTIRLDTMGFLYYAVVSVGTPPLDFLVALDTGSDLFWIPCDCKSCAPLTNNDYNVTFNEYSSNSSSTAKKVLCSSPMCEHQSLCTAPSDACPYNVQYLSSNTSSSGVLLEDVLHLTTQETSKEAINARVTFGCGQVQTGSFLSSSASNGLLGLGMDKLSVPSVLASGGLTSNSLSMCFGHDGVGRISFGDKGGSDQDETPFIENKPHPTYLVSVTGVKINNSTSPAPFNAFVDSGTSFTILSDPAYTILSESFNSVVNNSQRSTVPRIPFEYCYTISSTSKPTHIPDLSLVMKGGRNFPVVSPVVVVSTPVQDMYCLGVLKSQKINIIGQNFMTGLRVVFDREKLALGWEKFDCYDVAMTSPNTSFAMGPTSSDAAGKPSNGSQLANSSSKLPSWSSLSIVCNLLLFLYLIL